jgi:hypothetical protein
MAAPIFVPLLVATWLVGFAVLSGGSSLFLAILESSATPTARRVVWRGSSFRAWVRDGIDWPDEPFADHFAKGAYLFYLVVLWGGPAVLVARLAVGHSAWTSVLAGTIFWFVFPIGLLSSLASDSRWTPFTPRVLVAMACRPLQTLGFYLLSAPVLAVLVLTLDLALVHSSRVGLAWTLALAPAGSLAFFLYARLLGRLGMVLSFVEFERPEPRKPGRRRRRKPVNAYDERTRMFSPTEAVPDEPPSNAQPPEMPGLQTPYDGEVTGYGVDYSGAPARTEGPKPAPVIHTFDDEDDEPIRVADAPEISDDRHRIAAELARSTERELELHMPSRIEEPKNPYGVEAVAFLFDVKTTAPWTVLTAGFMLLAVLQRGMDMLRPE